ncbi:MAG TPA: acyltransferase, partial [Acidimicrobiia bacterium]|nr:acyltransferase [Acidimicrobiia bacterium]
MDDRPSGIAYLPGLDGLRALAIAAVLAFHDGRLPGGFLGVSIFFTISGYLITALVLAERRATGSVSLRAFYGRRARRLLPAAIAGLLLAALVTPYLHDPRVARALPGDVVAALANVANWHFLLAGRSYAAQFTSASPVLQFWSLSLEEQLYIVLVPCIVAVLWWARGRRLVLGGVLAALAAASLADGWVAVAHGSIDRAYYGTGTRAVEFLGGALLAVAVGRRAPGPRASRAAACAGPVALGALAAITLHARPTDTWLFRGEFAACTAASVVLIVSVAVPGPMRWFFSLAPLRALGKVSYGVYVYHWPLFLLLDHTRTGLAPLPLTFVRVGATVALATVSYFVIEQPIRVQRFPRVRWGWVAAPVAAMTAVSAAVIVAANAPPPAIQFQPVESASSVKALAAPPPAEPAPARSRPGAPRAGGA